MYKYIIFCLIALTTLSSFAFDEAPKASRKERIATGYSNDVNPIWKSYRALLETAGLQMGEITGVIIDQSNGHLEKIDFVHSNKNFKNCPWTQTTASFEKVQSLVKELKTKQKLILDMHIYSEFADGKIDTIQIFYCR